MPIYKGSTEVTSGNLYKGSTEIQDGYKATDSFYVNQTVISFSDYPGVTPNPKTFSGVPGDSVSPAANVSWSITAASGQAYQNAPTISGPSTRKSSSSYQIQPNRAMHAAQDSSICCYIPHD